jgi:chromosome segregation ATPase
MVYEEMIQKYEADVRMHLRHQNFLKLHIDTLQHNLDVAEKEVKEFKETLSQLNKNKEQLKFVHSKEIKKCKEHEFTLEKEVTTLKDKINELNMFITTNNAGSLATLDKRDPIFLTLASHPSQVIPKSKIISNKNESYRGGYLQVTCRPSTIARY